MTHPVISYIVRRVRNNQNFLGVLTGGTGSGKSYTCLSLSSMIHKEMGITMRPVIVYDATQLLNVINTIMENPNKYPKGLCIIVDEAGLMAHSRQFMSKINVALSKLVQSFRFMNLVCWFALPDFTFVDSHLRKMFHAHFMTHNMNRKRKLCFIKPYLLKNNQYTGKLLRVPLRFSKKNGETQVISTIGVPKPPDELCVFYEKKKQDYMKTLYVDFAEFDKPKGVKTK